MNLYHQGEQVGVLYPRPISRSIRGYCPAQPANHLSHTPGLIKLYIVIIHCFYTLSSPTIYPRPFFFQNSNYIITSCCNNLSIDASHFTPPLKSSRNLCQCCFFLVKWAVPLLCGLIYLHARYISITSPDISPLLPQCITHHLFLFTGLISNFRPFLPAPGAVQSWYQPPLSRRRIFLSFFLDLSLFQPNFSCPHISPSRESFQLKSCPYTFYHNKENPGDTLKNAHIFHISNRPIVRRLSGCEGDGQRGVFLLPLLNHGLHGEHGVHNVHHGVHLLLDHGVHAVTSARHHPPPRALSPTPSLSQFKIGKL